MWAEARECRAAMIAICCDFTLWRTLKCIKLPSKDVQLSLMVTNSTGAAFLGALKPNMRVLGWSRNFATLQPPCPVQTLIRHTSASISHHGCQAKGMIS
jgi:hypothetical protein